MRIKPTLSIYKSLIFILLMVFNTVANSQNDTINLNYKDVPLTTIFKSIENQSSFRIIYNTSKIDIEKKASIRVKNASIKIVLDILFKSSKIQYIIKDNQVLLTTAKIKKHTSLLIKKEERLIKGKVLSKATNEPLLGATVLIKGTAVGAITNEKGEFTYALKGNDINNMALLVSFLGYKDLEIPVKNNSYFNITLEEDYSGLNEVIITSSYGTKQLKEEVVGSISTLQSRDIATNQASESIDKMIEGQLAGVLVENTSGIGGPVSINIRGQGSLTPLFDTVLGTSTQPLIIVDGVIMSEESAIDSSFFDGSGTYTETLANPLSQISAENIESINVLKDAAAVSIYGADGANGVIIITTKKGQKGQTKFNFATQVGISSAINQIQYLNGVQYNELRNEYLTNTGSSTVPYNGVNTDWFSLLNNTGVYNKYNFAAAGGNGKLNFRTSVTYLDIEEPQKGNNSKQLNAGININYHINDLHVGLSLNPSYVKKNAPNIYYNYAFIPTLSPYNDDGSYSSVGVTGLGNPLAAINQNTNTTDTYGVLGSINLAYPINNNLKISTLFGLNFTDKEQDRYFSGENESGQYSGTFTLNGVSYPNYGRRVINNRNSTKWNWQGQLLYNKQFNNSHNIDGLIGFELSEDKANFSYASGRGFVNPNIINAVTNAVQDDDITTTADETTDNQTYDSDISYNSRVSIFSQINYNYKKRYYFLGNIRRDESSVFGSDTDVAYNGGVGVSWIISNENNFNSNFINFLKIKTSYGTTGNSRIGSYRSKGLYNTSANGYNNFDEATTSTAPNGYLSWEKNTKFNAGIDFNFLNSVQLSLEYYYDAISDLITSRNIPSETGYSSIQLNAASMYNKGLELSTKVNWIQSEKFNWNTSFNISTLRSKVTELKGLGSQYSSGERALAQKVGYSTTTIWGINWVGIDPGTGRDLLEKDGQVYDAVTYNNLFDSADWEPIGDTQPDAYGGFNNSFKFKNLSLSIRGSFQIGGDFLVEDELIAKYSNTSNRNLSVNAYDYWRNQGDIALQPIVTSNNPTISNYSKYLFDNTYLKLSNINLTYNFPLNSVKFLNNLSVFLDVSNVGYWYKDKSPYDRNGIREFKFNYPQARTISMGINGKF
ncbi:SusC/RagA family TonB-linked outer membrane protein [Tamlana sp. 62-3]|uniref:SusC/RagA family TonB-linked outer membrane protein n=1 Tax=Neotamlana sargassicola TaxID=2883125 RepID=A0A9X1I5E9_9FLAO|nr:SusC/RagA family TonB-linked outer membrane protein [Tamlana sargassicola]MCB4807597.1 SusC/RagA family TonB-linked outer membrane protein [Tamlana sargassicola]